MRLLLHNIKSLVQAAKQIPRKISGKDMRTLPVIDNAWLYCEGEKIVDFGKMEDLPERYMSSETVFDASGRFVMPAYCDPHTHLVYAGSREREFVDRIKGLSYEAIAKRGGGIQNSAKLLHGMQEDELFEQSEQRVLEIMRQGTGAVEIKSGYGLNTPDELKMLRVIRRIKKELPLAVKSTFLGAHSVPDIFKNNREGYIDLIINEMLPAISSEGLADYIDVFCDEGFFTPAETERLLRAGPSHGLIPKIHANELARSGGVQVGVKNNALSVDHLEFIGDDEIKVLSGSDTMPTLLPGASFFLGIGYAPARKMIDAGLPVALATDYNPGSAPSGNMSFIFTLACLNLHMLPEEAFNAMTINAAYAMGVQDILGSITPGKLASFMISKKIPALEFIPYSFGADTLEHVFCKGKLIR